MKAVFIESREFTEWVAEFLPDDAYAALQQELLDQPDKGAVMPGCGGLRKVRVAAPQRGKGNGEVHESFISTSPKRNGFSCSTSTGKMRRTI